MPLLLTVFNTYIIMELNFYDLQVLAKDLSSAIVFDNLLTEDSINENQLDSHCLAVCDSERNWSRIDALNKLLLELLKYRPLPF